MDLETIINDVLPEGSTLYKCNHGRFDFFLDDRSLEDGCAFLSQEGVESFKNFIERLVLALLELEKNEDEPLVAINCAINKIPVEQCEEHFYEQCDCLGEYCKGFDN